MKKPRPRAIKERAAKTAAVTSPASALAMEAPAPAAKKKRTGPLQFIREVRAEAKKITWTSRKETIITSVMVFIMVFITGIFFMIVDFLLHGGVNYILKFANSGSLS
jgi:preprotein translocase subunit SecE